MNEKQATYFYKVINKGLKRLYGFLNGIQIVEDNAGSKIQVS